MTQGVNHGGRIIIVREVSCSTAKVNASLTCISSLRGLAKV